VQWPVLSAVVCPLHRLLIGVLLADDGAKGAGRYGHRHRSVGDIAIRAFGVKQLFTKRYARWQLQMVFGMVLTLRDQQDWLGVSHRPG